MKQTPTSKLHCQQNWKTDTFQLLKLNIKLAIFVDETFCLECFIVISTSIKFEFYILSRWNMDGVEICLNLECF